MVKIRIRDLKEEIKYAPKGTWLYYWRTKSKYLAIIFIGAIILAGIYFS